jgi:NAD(P)-dependent dehydrogenase (short-subunit alcohol dehydrogenase family)
VVRLDGQVALVTGAGRGIGRAIALALSGAAVAVCARSKDEVTSVAGQIEGSGGARWLSGMRRCCRACSLGATGGSSTSPAASA